MNHRSQQQVQRQIMVIEDFHDLRDFVITTLEDRGISCVPAANGRDALALLAAPHAIELIILDLHMPVLNGYEFLKEKAQIPNLNKIPVIIFSANTDRHSLLGVGGVIATLDKSTALTELLNKVMHLLNHE